ncbi:MAG: DNA polymerase III subunit gamma/tau [candidate division Zixibacteria bacterium]
MSYQVLALKYRPLVFEDLIAQEHVTKTLTRAVETGRIANGYLLTGPRGTGKTTTARILAKALNCVEGPTPTPCNKCSICKEITSGSSLDVLEIDAASNTGVDDIRTLRENIRYLPTSGKKRVFIIDEVHRLSGSAFDALLKTLEEPPEHAVFIFATTEPHKVPPTILSRTQRYDFHRVSATDLSAHLEKLAKLEKVDIEKEAVFLIARKGEGSVRDAISLLDQMIALSEDKITAAETARTLGIVDRQLFVKLLDIIAAGKTDPIFDLVQKLFASGASIKEFVNDFINYLRNLLVQKSSSEPDKFLDISAAEKEALIKQTAYFTEADILRMIQILSELNSELKRGYDERIFLEICLVRLTRMESSISLQEVIERLNRLAGSGIQSDSPGETNLFGNSVSPPVPPQPATKSQKKTELSSDNNIRDPQDFIEDGKPLNLPRVQMSWNRFLEELKNRKQMLASLLAMGHLHNVKDNEITIGFAPSYGPNKQVIEKPESISIVEETLRDFYKIAVRIKFVIDSTIKTPVHTKQEPENLTINAEDLFAKDPDLKKMVERIDGEIVGRRKIEGS